MDDKFTFTLKSPITDEQWDKITDVDFEHTDRIWFETKNGKVEFLKAFAQPERKSGRWIDAQYPFSKCSICKCYFDTANNIGNFCPNCGAKMEGQDG